MKKWFLMLAVVFMLACEEVPYPKYHLAEQVKADGCVGVVVGADYKTDGKWWYTVAFQLKCPTCSGEKMPDYIPAATTYRFPEDKLSSVTTPPPAKKEEPPTPPTPPPAFAPVN